MRLSCWSGARTIGENEFSETGLRNNMMGASVVVVREMEDVMRLRSGMSLGECAIDQ